MEDDGRGWKMMEDDGRWGWMKNEALTPKGLLLLFVLLLLDVDRSLLFYHHSYFTLTLVIIVWH